MSTPPSSKFVAKWKKVIAAPTRSGNRVDYLVDGWATYDAMYSALQTTLKGDASAYYVYLLGWWLDDGLELKSGDSNSAILPLLARLAEKAQVRVMLYDNILKSVYVEVVRAARSFGAMKAEAPGRTPKEQVDEINKMPGAQAILDGNVVGYPMFQSHHHKLLLVRGSQGLIGFCGGVDISFDRIRPVWQHAGSPFHDVHCRIQGPAARDLVSVFVERWKSHPIGSQSTSKLRALIDLPPVTDTSDESAEKSVGDQYVGIVRTFVRPKGPCYVARSFEKTLINAIQAARQFIYAEDQYMVSTDIGKSLGKALNHLQYAYILIPHTVISDLARCWDARAAFVEALYSAAGSKTNREKFKIFYKIKAMVNGKALDEKPQRTIPVDSPPKPYQLKQMPSDWDTSPSTGMPNPEETPIDPSIPTKDDLGQHTYVHSKTWIFDDELALIGTANCNRRGLYFDSEVDAAIFDFEPSLSKGQSSFARRLRAHLWSEHLNISEAEACTDKAEERWLRAPATALVREYHAHDPLPATVSDWFFAPPLTGSTATRSTMPLDGTTYENNEKMWDILLDPPGKPPDPCPRA